MKKRTEKSEKRTKFLFILIILTAILSITATYAWFSTQRDVEISNLRVRVESTENLQISLDGEVWAQSIEIKDMRQLYGTYASSGDSTTIYQAKDDSTNHNYVPTELLPVSADGTITEGVLNLVKGDIDGRKLENITNCNEDDLKTVTGEDGKTRITTKEANNSKHPYLVFDIYLRNLSRKEGGDELHLDKGSKVWIDTGSGGVEGTGLENSARIGFLPYKTTAELTDEGETIRGLSATGDEKVAIWEPNFKTHTDYVVTNDSRITGTDFDFTTKPVKFDGAAGKTITDVTQGEDAQLADITTVKPAYTDVNTGTTEEKELVDAVGGSDKIILESNKITKVRVYLWLEGQDPDCTDMASTGKQVSATIKLIKPVSDGSDGYTYSTASGQVEP